MLLSSILQKKRSKWEMETLHHEPRAGPGGCGGGNGQAPDSWALSRVSHVSTAPGL